MLNRLSTEELADLRRRAAQPVAPPRRPPPAARTTGTGIGRLTWRPGLDIPRTEVAEAAGGRYLLTPTITGRWDLCWMPRSGRLKTYLGGSLHREEAEKMAQRHLLTGIADEALKNAGAGDLTKKELKGTAVKRVGRKRRA